VKYPTQESEDARHQRNEALARYPQGYYWAYVLKDGARSGPPAIFEHTEWGNWYMAGIDELFVDHELEVVSARLEPPQ
jgi:hypothetical protein